MKSLVLLWSTLARDLASACHTSTDRDVRTVAGRTESEGTSFLTITLPAFGKAFDLALQEGTLATTSFRKVRGGLPAFLQGFLRQIFDADGVLLTSDKVSVDAVDAVRQLCYVFQKIELDCADHRREAALTAFEVADMETGIWDDQDHSELLLDLERIASELFREVITKVDKLVYEGDLLPAHGPGTTAEKLLGNSKYDLTYWPARLEAEFPYREFGIPSPRFDMFCRTGRVQQPVTELEDPARVITVPKTLKTPRVISAEPAALQWIQQSIARPLVRFLESDSLTGGLIGFTDQEPNQRMAQLGSIHGHLATLDLKEASDRVSSRQVASVFRRWGATSRAIFACRSNLAKLPSGKVLTLRKFAPMGSALCFPTEAMVFLAAVMLGIERNLVRGGGRCQLRRSMMYRYIGSVRVYGDDIVVPIEHVESIKEVFSEFNWLVNSEKSFVKGDFRESCGGDFYRGENVTPVKLTRMLPESSRNIELMESLVSFRNRLYLKGLWGTCKVLDHWIRELAPYPLVSADSPMLGRLSFLPHEDRVFVLSGDKWDPDHQCVLRRGLVAFNKIPVSPISDVGALLKCLLVSSEETDHLQRAGRPVARKAKLQYGRPF